MLSNASETRSRLEPATSLALPRPPGAAWHACAAARLLHTSKGHSISSQSTLKRLWLQCSYLMADAFRTNHLDLRELSSIIAQHLPSAQPFGKQDHSPSSLAEIAAEFQDSYFLCTPVRPGQIGAAS